jgi:hypothetical protein
MPCIEQVQPIQVLRLRRLVAKSLRFKVNGVVGWNMRIGELAKISGLGC